MHKGEIWWASLRAPRGSEPGKRRPVLIVQSNDFNRSNISTIIVATITSNLHLAEAPGNFRLTAKASSLKKSSVVNVSQILTLDKSFLTEKIGKLPNKQIDELNNGLKLVLSLT